MSRFALLIGLEHFFLSLSQPTTWLLKIGMYCDGPTAIKAAVRQNMGVGIAFEDAVKSEVISGEFKILKVPGIELEGASFIIYSKKRKLSPLALEFLELLRSARTKREEVNSAVRRAALARRPNEGIFTERPAIA
jgi:DNA-binding transcriptional LysR family regulator